MVTSDIRSQAIWIQTTGRLFVTAEHVNWPPGVPSCHGRPSMRYDVGPCMASTCFLSMHTAAFTAIRRLCRSAEGHHHHQGRAQGLSLIGHSNEEVLWQMWQPNLLPS